MNQEESHSYDVPHSSRGPYPDPHDHRDYVYSPPVEPLAYDVDLRTSCPVVYDQKHMGSCTANAVAGAFEFISMKQGLPFSPSRLFIWYYARQMSGDRHAVLKNVGSCIRHTVASLSKNLHGVCSESDWSYEEGQYDEKTKFFINHAKAAKKPPPLAVQNAHKHTAVKYYSITKENRLYKLKKRLDDGYPFLFSLTPCDGLHELGPDSDYKLSMLILGIYFC